MQKPLICLAEENTPLPFDIKDERTIFYRDDLHGVQDIVPELEKMIRAVHENWKPDNPITRGSTRFKLESSTVKASGVDAIMSRLDEIERTVQGPGSSKFSRAIPIPYDPFNPSEQLYVHTFKLQNGNIGAAIEKAVKFLKSKGYTVTIDEDGFSIHQIISGEHGKALHLLFREENVTKMAESLPW